jgi:hypothetical protein
MSINWKTNTTGLPSTSPFVYTAAGNGTFCVSDGSNVYHSTNGKNWVLSTIDTAYQNIFVMKFLNNEFIILSYDGLTRASMNILASADGVNFVTVGTYPFSGASVGDITFGGGIYCVLVNLVIYAGAYLGSLSVGVYPSTNVQSVLTYSGSKFLLFNNYEQKLYTSSTGLLWSSGVVLFSAGQNFVNILNGNNKLILIQNGKSAYSINNGVTWVLSSDTSTSGTNGTWISSDSFISVQGAQYYITNNYGQTWPITGSITSQFPSSAAFGISYDNGIYVVPFDTGSVSYASNLPLSPPLWYLLSLVGGVPNVL